MHQLVIKNFDNSRMHGKNVKKKLLYSFTTRTVSS
jgi:hypothetical protein